MSIPVRRRDLIEVLGVTLAGAAAPLFGRDRRALGAWWREVGVTTSSFARQLAAAPERFRLPELVEVRKAGLARTFPGAVTCDFKAHALGPDGGHAAYDLERCFTLGWDAGFRGPWCLEHAHPDARPLFRELGLLHDLLRRWMAGRG